MFQKNFLFSELIKTEKLFRHFRAASSGSMWLECMTILCFVIISLLFLFTPIMMKSLKTNHKEYRVLMFKDKIKTQTFVRGLSENGLSSFPTRTFSLLGYESNWPHCLARAIFTVLPMMDLDMGVCSVTAAGWVRRSYLHIFPLANFKQNSV